MHQLVQPRYELRRLLVYFGGVDEHNLTLKVLRALMSSELSNLAVDVVLGMQSPNRHLIEELVDQRPFTTLHEPMPSLAGLIVRADLAIGAGGATTWERACLGLPSLIIATDDNQWPFVKALHQAKFIKCLGKPDQVGVEDLRSAVLSLQQDLLSFRHCHALSDGWGSSRVTTHLLGLASPPKLRFVSSSDHALLLHWVKESFFLDQNGFQHLTVSDECSSWLESGLSSSDCMHWIATDRSGCPLGYIRVDQGVCVGSGNSVKATINLFLDRSATGKDLSYQLLGICLDAVEQHWRSESKALSDSNFGTTVCKATFIKPGFFQGLTFSQASSFSKAEADFFGVASRLCLCSQRSIKLD